MNYLECLKKGKLEKVGYGAKAAKTERAEAVLDLATAEESLEKEDYKWVIIQAYYAAFHSCKAVVLNHGYREKSHDCLITAWERFSKNKKLGKTLRKLKGLRNQAGYGCNYSKEDAIEAINDAKRIIAANN